LVESQASSSDPADVVPLLIVFVVGACVGSFLNVCITRIPKKESIVFPASHCRNCLAPIAFFDNIPLLSFLLLKGRCRACGMPIPLRYEFVELVTAILALTLFLRFGSSWLFFVYAIFVGGLVVVSFVDLEEGIVPDIVSLPGTVLGLTLSGLAWLLSIDEFPSPLNSLLGALLGGGMFWVVAFVYEWFRGREGLGFGDVKLMAMIGAFLGWSGVPITLFVGAGLGSLWGIGLMLVRGVDTKHALPFAPFLCTGAFVNLIWGTHLAAWYLTGLR